MSSFRFKPKKNNKNKRHITTLEQEHRKKDKYFNSKQNKLPNKKIELNQCKKELKELEEKNACDYTDIDINNKANLKDKIIELEREIYNIENNIEEMDYYYKTSELICDYYDNTYENNDIVVTDIMDFFNNKSIVKDTNKNKATLLNDYNKIIGQPCINKNKSYNFIKYCNNCNIEKVINPSEGICECIQCGETELIIVESDRPNYKDPIPDNSAYAYKRINHQELRWLIVGFLLLCDINNKVKSTMSHLINTQIVTC
jgi:hypothetical protein